MDIAGTPFEWLEFDEHGVLRDPGAPARVAALLKRGVTDLVVLSHGWKTDKAGAMELYGPLWTNTRIALGNAEPRFVVAGVQWPSKEFRTDFDAQAADAGAAPLPSPIAGPNRDLSPAALAVVRADAAALAGPHGGPLETAAQAAEANLRDEADTLVAALNRAFPARITNNDEELQASREPLAENDPSTILRDLLPAPAMPLSSGVGSAQGLGSLIGQALSGPRAAIGRLLNQFTYYEMKARAGDIGAALGARVLPALAPASPVRLHLAGHSFGGRVVTAATAAFTPTATLTLQSLTLLQAAFSHNALSADFGAGHPGAFARVVGKVAGPISATHTHRDSACTLLYALASRLVRDNAAAIGDVSDQFGSIGANGILHLSAGQEAAAQVMAAGATYRFTAGKAHNFSADAAIASHMDVTNDKVAALLAAAMLT